MSDGIYLCKDCGQPMQLDYQEQRNAPPLPIVTCKNKDCALWSVTLSTKVYYDLTNEQLNAYREMVALLKKRFNKE